MTPTRWLGPVSTVVCLLAAGCNPFTNPNKDADGDGFQATRFGGDDCNDADPAIYPDAPEVCNNIDDDCDDETDEGFDADGDGWLICSGDCDDADPWINPDSAERCNQLDDDCDGQTDEDSDTDGDGWLVCGGDCDDTDPNVNPNATEVCNNVDDDCDGTTDGGDDSDGDGFGVCDCDDSDPDVFPDATEVCNGIDDDCDGQTDEGMDVVPCDLQAGVCQGAQTGCVDGVALPCDYGPDYEAGAESTCDGLDNNCDGQTDEGLLLLEPESGAQAGDGIDNNCNGLIDEPGGVMVPIPGMAGTWIDAYEMTVYENADCTGQRFGEGSDDYPINWPDEGEAQVLLYACSLPGIVPSGHLSFYQARRACVAQGKHLCQDFEYRRGCDGNTFNLFPYANIFVPGICNDPIGGLGQVAPTGSHDQCTANGTTFDMSGNLAEWVDAEVENNPDMEGYHPVGGYGYSCELFYLGTLLTACDPDNPTITERQMVEDVAQCPVFDFMGGEGYVHRAFLPQTVKPYFGGRCCYP